jgi:tetratricopeptide (TPR) repeat protein
VRNLLVLTVLCIAIDLNAQQAGNTAKPAANFQSEGFRSALATVLRARFNSFAELKAGETVFQLPQMNCSLSSPENLTSYSCSKPGSLPSEARDVYDGLSAAVASSLPGYPTCQNSTAEDGVELTSYCHYPDLLIADALVRKEKGLVKLEVFSRAADDPIEPAKLLHAYTLADLGRHAEAMKAFEPILGSDERFTHIYAQERTAYDRAVKWTQDCAGNQSCSADDFLAIGNTAEALRWQSQWFKTLRRDEKINLNQGEELDPASARRAILADAYDLNARIQAAEGKLGPALRDLDSAIVSLPQNGKASPREARYYYHRALILAENKKFADAAKACRQSLEIEGSHSAPGKLREPQCVEIDQLALAPADGPGHR